jgi:hypothetical protein
MWRFVAILALSARGNAESKTPTPIQRRHQEEHMGLSPLALNVVMAVIAISIPLLIYGGCLMTRKKHTPPTAETVTHYEFDRAA